MYSLIYAAILLAGARRACVEFAPSLLPFQFYSMSYVVASKIKELVKKMDMMASGDLAEAASSFLEDALKTAVKRAKENGRKTVRPCDL